MKSITPNRCQEELQQSGSADFGFAFGDQARFRVSVFKQRGFISMVLRQIPNAMLTPEQLGLPDVCVKLVMRPRGLFLVTGPTGSGKSTTLASLINYINESVDHHIITIEDPIEFFHYHKKSTINQREVGVDVPAATVIVLMRHPFDIAASVVRLGWYDPASEPGDAFVTEGQSWCHRHSAAVRDVRAAHVEWCTYEELSAQTDGQSLEELIELVTTRRPTWRGLVSTRATREQRSATDFAGVPVTIEDAWRDRAYEYLVATGWSELYGRDSQQLQPVKQFLAGRRN